MYKSLTYCRCTHTVYEHIHIVRVCSLLVVFFSNAMLYFQYCYTCATNTHLGTEWWCELQCRYMSNCIRIIIICLHMYARTCVHT